MKLSALAALAVVLTACGDPTTPHTETIDAGRDVYTPPPDRWQSIGDVLGFDAVCEELLADPLMPRVVVGGSTMLRVRGGSGTAWFSIVGDALGSELLASGGFRAGTTPGRVTLHARDVVCGLDAEFSIEIVAGLRILPREAVVAPGGVVTFRVEGALASVQWRTLSTPAMGDGMFDAATARFRAGRVPGHYRYVVRDMGSMREESVNVEVRPGAVFAPENEVVLVPAERTVDLRWVGASTEITAAIEGAGAGRITQRNGTIVYDATGARAGAVIVRGTDRATGATATVRVVVGESSQVRSTPRGEDQPYGALAWGDFDGDGRQDLAMAQSAAHSTAPYAGRILIWRGAVGEPAVWLEGDRSQDYLGQVLRAADINGDGRTDLVVGSPERDLHRANVGSVEVYYGTPTGLSTTTAEVFVGNADNERFGAAVSLVDVNADRVLDLIVAAPLATPRSTPAGQCAALGQVYIFRGLVGSTRPFELEASQALDLIVPQRPPAACRANDVFSVSESPAVIDVDLDGRMDLVVGLPSALTAIPNYYGAVVVYRGTMGGGFETRPSWVIDIAERVTQGAFGAGVDAVDTGSGRALIVRAPSYNRHPTLDVVTPEYRGALFSFVAGPTFARTAGAPVTFVTTTAARVRIVGEGNDSLGRNAAVGDLDGDGAGDYLVGGMVPGAAVEGRLWSWPLRVFAGGVPSTPTLNVRGMSAEALGAALAVAPAPPRQSAAVAVWTALRNTPAGFRAGALSVLSSGAATTMQARWDARTTMNPPLLAGGDEGGTTIALGAFGSSTGGDLLVGTPGAHSPAMGALPAGYAQRVGALAVLRASDGNMSVSIAGERSYSNFGRFMTTLDFNGDGRLDVAVGDPNGASGGLDALRAGRVLLPASTGCMLRDATGAAVDVSPAGRGLVRVFTQGTDGSLSERFHLYPHETGVAGREQRNGFGGFLANAGDVNGDGLEDLAVGHVATTVSNGAEVVLGRSEDTARRILIACGDPLEAPWWPTRIDNAVYAPVAGLGDIDNDGCSDVAAGLVGGGAKAAVSVRFGFGSRCRNGHTRPFDVNLVFDLLQVEDNVVGMVASRANDEADRSPYPRLFGHHVRGVGDVTGDGVPDLAVRANSEARGDGSDPVVHVISGAWITSLCPTRVCANGLRSPFFVDGDYRVAALQHLGTSARISFSKPERASSSFGWAIAGTDLDGDNISDLIVGAADGAQTPGTVLAWRGGRTLGGAPWLRAVGGLGEEQGFGASVSAFRSRDRSTVWLAAGAPRSNRQGAWTGAVYRWRLSP
jgi:hypothetical protein